jgi:hypothetical protein
VKNIIVNKTYKIKIHGIKIYRIKWSTGKRHITNGKSTPPEGG